VSRPERIDKEGTEMRTTLRVLAVASCAVVLLLLPLGQAAYAQTPPEVFTALTHNLQTIAATSWDGCPVEREAANQTLMDPSITSAEWQTFFDGYFAANPITEDLGGYLQYPILYWGQPAARANVQNGIYTSLLANVHRIIGTDAKEQLIARLSSDVNAAPTFSYSNFYLQFLSSDMAANGVRSAVYADLKGIAQSRPDIFDPAAVFDPSTQHYLSKVRGEMQMSLAEAFLANPGLYPAGEKDTVGALIEPAGLKRDLVWKYSGLAIVDNNRMDDTQTIRVYLAAQNIPAAMRDCWVVSVNDFFRSDNLQLRAAKNAVNIFPDKVGAVPEDEIDDGIVQQSDIFSMALIHEMNHLVTDKMMPYGSAFWTKRETLISDAGTVTRNYIRSQIVSDPNYGPAFFVDNHQEFFASISNSYFGDSMATLKLCQTRLGQGYVQPLKQFLFFTDVYSQGGPSSTFYKVDLMGNWTVTPITLIREPSGDVVGLIVSGTTYDFVKNLDKTAPTASITSPSNNTTITGQTTVSVSASDNYGVSRVELWVDNKISQTATRSPYSFSLNAGALSAGSHTLVAKAYDRAGNVGTSASVLVKVPDTAPPTVSITSPSAGSTVPKSCKITVQASDNVKVTQVKIYCDATLLTIWTSSPYTYTWNTQSLPRGSHILRAEAYDAAGNKGVASVTVKK
jgi:hypothetical protein